MRYSADHKAKARAHIVEQAGALSKKEGFAGTGVDRLMQASGLTSGAFYKHFTGKEELLQAITEAELNKSIEVFFSGLNAQPGLESLLARYLSTRHARHPDQGCVLPTLSVEVGRASVEVKQAYELGLITLHQKLRACLEDEESAWAALATCVGALMMARAVHQAELAKEILDACKQSILSRI